MKYPDYALVLSALILLCSVSSVIFAANNTKTSCIGSSCTIGDSAINACNPKDIQNDSSAMPKISETSHSLESVHWREYSLNVINQAIKDHTQIIVFVMSSQCEWSQKMIDITFHHSDIIKMIKQKFVPLYFNFDSNEALAAQYKVISLPTTIFLNDEGVIIRKFSGYIAPDEMMQLLHEQTSEKAK
jgi:thioredoxin-related protein